MLYYDKRFLEPQQEVLITDCTGIVTGKKKVFRDRNLLSKAIKIHLCSPFSIRKTYFLLSKWCELKENYT